MYLWVYPIKVLRFDHTVYFSGFYETQSKQRLSPYTPLTGFYNRDDKCLLRGTKRTLYNKGWFRLSRVTNRGSKQVRLDC